MPKSYLSARVAKDALARLERRARRMGVPRSRLVERYVDEGLRMDEHPGIVFVDGPAGRRPALRGGPDIWEVVTTWQDNDRSVADTAEYLSLPDSRVQVALDYYADHRQELDEWIRLNDETAEAAEAAWRRQQAARA